MKKIATVVSLLLFGLVILRFFRQESNNQAYISNYDEDPVEMIGQETLKHL